MSEKRRLKPAKGFKSIDEEVAHYGRHGSAGDVDDGAHVDFDVAPEARTRMISIRLPGDLLDRVRAVARQGDVPYQSLMKRWLREALQRVESKPSMNVAREEQASYGRVRVLERVWHEKKLGGACQFPPKKLHE
jgi:transposase-like protein